MSARVDATGSAGRHQRVWRMIGSRAALAAELREGDVLFEEDLGEVDGGRFDLTLPMSGIVRLRLRPA